MHWHLAAAPLRCMRPHARQLPLGGVWLGHSLWLSAEPSVRPYMVNPCTDPSSGQADLPWCDPTLPVDTRVSDMLARMTLAEKIGNLDTTAPVPLSPPPHPSTTRARAWPV